VSARLSTILHPLTCWNGSSPPAEDHYSCTVCWLFHSAPPAAPLNLLLSPRKGDMHVKCHESSQVPKRRRTRSRFMLNTGFATILLLGIKITGSQSITAYLNSGFQFAYTTESHDHFPLNSERADSNTTFHHVPERVRIQTRSSAGSRHLTG
jgi:hypothetical protein